MRQWTQKGPLLHESGFYHIDRETYCYSVWFTHPKDYRRLGDADTLAGAKQIAERESERIEKQMEAKNV